MLLLINCMILEKTIHLSVYLIVFSIKMNVCDIFHLWCLLWECNSIVNWLCGYMDVDVCSIR